jgi:hypothetical protein
MAISALPSSGASISLQRVITTSGWIDLGDPRLIHFVLAGGGGGGGGGASNTGYGGGGGGGGGGAIAGKLFIGGRVYVQIGAGGTAGAAGATTANTRAGVGGNSYLGIPFTVSNSADASGMYWIAGIGGAGGANGTSSPSGADADIVRISLDATGRPSVTGYTSPNTIVIGSGPGRGGGGGYGSGNGNGSGDNSSYYPNVAGSNNGAYSLILHGWANNDMRWFSGPSGTSVQQSWQGISGLNWTDFPIGLFNPGSGTYQAPWSLWTSGQSANGGTCYGGNGGSTVNQPVGLNGTQGMFTGAGGGGSSQSYMSGSGGGGAFNRGGESSRMFGNATNYGGGGGAGILRPGSNGIIAVNGSTGGKGGDGGLGGGGGGGSQCNSTGVSGGVGGQGALTLFW